MPSPSPDRWLPVALIQYLAEERGRAASLARAVRVRATQVAKWVNGDRPIPEKRCVLIEIETGGRLKRQELREDWREIWPELLSAAEAGSQVEGERAAGALHG